MSSGSVANKAQKQRNIYQSTDIQIPFELVKHAANNDFKQSIAFLGDQIDVLVSITCGEEKWTKKPCLYAALRYLEGGAVRDIYSRIGLLVEIKRVDIKNAMLGSKSTHRHIDRSVHPVQDEVKVLYRSSNAQNHDKSRVKVGVIKNVDELKIHAVLTLTLENKEEIKAPLVPAETYPTKEDVMKRINEKTAEEKAEWAKYRAEQVAAIEPCWNPLMKPHISDLKWAVKHELEHERFLKWSDKEQARINQIGDDAAREFEVWYHALSTSFAFALAYPLS